MAKDVLSSDSLSIVAIATGMFLARGLLTGVVDEDAREFTGKTRGAPDAIKDDDVECSLPLYKLRWNHTLR